MFDKTRWPYNEAVTPHERHDIRTLTGNEAEGMRVFWACPYAAVSNRPAKDRIFDHFADGSYPITANGAYVVFTSEAEANEVMPEGCHARSSFLWEVVKASGDAPVYVRVN